MNRSNWQGFLNSLLTQNGQFKLISTAQKGQTTSEVYQQQVSDEETLIEVGYLKNERLITLEITNPKTPGHNAEQIEYFYENDFDASKKFRITEVGLLFNQVNISAIEKILKSGLIGNEKKYFINGKLQFSIVSKPFDDGQEYSMTHHFSDKSFWIRLFKKILNPKTEYFIEQINLKEMFGGVK